MAARLLCLASLCLAGAAATSDDADALLQVEEGGRPRSEYSAPFMMKFANLMNGFTASEKKGPGPRLLYATRSNQSAGTEADAEMKAATKALDQLKNGLEHMNAESLRVMHSLTRETKSRLDVMSKHIAQIQSLEKLGNYSEVIKRSIFQESEFKKTLQKARQLLKERRNVDFQFSDIIGHALKHGPNWKEGQAVQTWVREQPDITYFKADEMLGAASSILLEKSRDPWSIVQHMDAAKEILRKGIATQRAATKEFLAAAQSPDEDERAAEMSLMKMGPVAKFAPTNAVAFSQSVKAGGHAYIKMGNELLEFYDALETGVDKVVSGMKAFQMPNIALPDEKFLTVVRR